VAALATTTSDAGVADYVREFAPEIAKGKNLVNVVLADVRSLDTLMETVVVLLGTLGVVGVLKGCERPVGGLGRRLGSNAASPASTAGGLLPGLSRIIVPIGLLFSLVMLIKGHNSPGGGFVAGLALGVTAMIGMAALGPTRFGRRLRVSLSGSAILGCSLMLASGAIGWLTGRPYLTHLHGALTIGELYMPLHTTMIFDLGVMLAVAGGIGAAGMALWTTAERNEPGEPG
jgi:multisubunit Na+/H+ antiporter MnhB subunit